MNGNVDESTAVTIESVLQATWPLPMWLTIVLATLAILFVGAIYLSERGQAGRGLRLGLASLRFSLLALVVWMWAGWGWLQYRSDKPELLFVLDRSASMQTTDSQLISSPSTKPTQSKVSRFSSVVDFLSNMDAKDRKRLERDYQIRWILIDESPQPAEISLSNLREELSQIAVNGTQSRLGDSLTSILAGQAGRSTAAVVAISDGINTSGSPLSAAAAMARSAAIPIYAVATGQELAVPDARLADLLVDDVVFLGDQVVLQVTVGTNDVAEANLTLNLKDGSSGELLDQQTVKLTSALNQQQLSMAFTPKRAGDLPLQIELSELPGEINLENNILQRTIVVQDKTLRVLLVQRFPSFEFRFLKNLLQRSQATDERAASFELHSVLQDADALYIEQDDAAIRLVPSDPELLASYDVFIFGDISPELISRSAQQQIFRQVTESGAGCVFIAGRDTAVSSLVGWPLGDLLPIQLKDAAKPHSSGGSEDAPQRWAPTILGSSALPMQIADSPDKSLKVWLTMPPIVSLYSALTPKLGSQVIAAAAPLSATQYVTSSSDSQTPLLISQFAGAGRVAFQATDETYRWTSHTGTDRYHQRYWEQMLRWLSRGRMNSNADLSRLTVEPRRAKLGETIRFELRLGNEVDAKLIEDQAELTLMESGGKQSTLMLSRDATGHRLYSGSRSDLAPGSYRTVLFQPSLAQPPSESFSVTTPPGEQANLRADWSAMKQLAEQSRGRFYQIDAAQRLFSELPTGKRSRLGTLPPIPLWNSPWIATLFVVLITTEWLLRRKARML
jgi:hypothetical protein